MHFKVEANTHLKLSEMNRLVAPGATISISPEVQLRVSRCRDMLREFISHNRVIYGVNTSMGGFAHFLVPIDRAKDLQNNLINAVATNVGEYIDDKHARAAMLARIISLSRGNSAISVENLERLIAIYNAGIIPCIPEKGSLGTSGDLGPLAAIALVATGQWKARYKEKEMLAVDALAIAGIPPLELDYKEGLALINGTSAMVGMAALTWCEASALLDKYLKISILSLEVLRAKTKPFDPRVHLLKPHPGQRLVAKKIWKGLKDSKLAVDENELDQIIGKSITGSIHAHKEAIEDAYSLRCTPQILGPVWESLQFIKKIIENELNSSNDNPLIVVEEKEVFHNGHFHGQYIAMAMDHLVIALVTICNLSDRRIDRLLKETLSGGLPPFLCQQDAGLRLGLMGGQFMSTSLTAENRSLCVPISVQSLPSTADFQDVVSLGFVAARRARDILQNTKYIVAFELMCGGQAADIRGIEKLGSAGKNLYKKLRETVPYLSQDVSLTTYLENIASRLI